MPTLGTSNTACHISTSLTLDIVLRRGVGRAQLQSGAWFRDGKVFPVKLAGAGAWQLVDDHDADRDHVFGKATAKMDPQLIRINSCIGNQRGTEFIAGARTRHIRASLLNARVCNEVVFDVPLAQYDSRVL